MNKQTKQYAILHIESGEYIKSVNLRILDGYLVIKPLASFNGIFSFSNLYTTQNSLKLCDIFRRDYQLKSHGIYFNDKVSAITFLRDIYLPEMNDCRKSYNYRYEEEDRIRMLKRNEFEIVEI